MSTLGLHTLPSRCANGFHDVQHPGLCQCSDRQPVAPADEWSVFVAALKSAARDDNTVHACDVRPLIRGRIEPKRIGLAWRRARSQGLLVEVGHERSDDEAGKNAGRMEPFYSLKDAA